MFANINFNRRTVTMLVEILLMMSVFVVLALQDFPDLPSLILILYFAIFVVRQTYHRAITTVQLQAAADGQIVARTSALRIMAPFLLFLLSLFGLGLILSLFSAFSSSVEYQISLFLSNLISISNTLFVPFAFMICLVLFLCGVFLFFIPGQYGKNLAKRRVGKIFMSTAFLTGLAIIIFWTAVNTFIVVGFDGAHWFDTTIPLPPPIHVE